MQEPLLENKNILVVEDNMINQLIVKHTLDKLGAKVEISESGIGAIEKLSEQEFDLIIMDIQLPGMSGYEVTSYVRDQLKSNIPIMAMTAFALQGEEEKCIAAGMNGYVSKPFTVESLYASIKKVFESKIEAYINPYIFSNKNVTVDITLLYEIAGDDIAYVKSMINTFLETVPNSLKMMDESLAVQDFENLYKHAHYAKSSLSVIKVGDTFKIIQEIEQLSLKGKNVQALTYLVNEVKEKFAIAQQMLQQRLSTAV